MNILEFCYEYPPLGGGGGQVVSGLSKQLAVMGHSVDLITMKYKELPGYEQRGSFCINRVRCIRKSSVVCSPYEMLSYLITSLPKALKMAEKKKYDIIHSHFILPDGILAMLVSKVTGIPYVITAHGSDVPGYNPDRFIVMHKILRPLWKTIVRSCSQVICLSHFLEILLKDTLPDAETIVIPNGFQAGRFRSNRLRSNRILIVSRIFQRKGVQHFIEAVKGLTLDFEIHVVGDGPYLKALKQQAESITSRIHFHGFIKNSSQQFRELVETSKIFVLASQADNFPVVLLEAMDAGMAIITTRGTGCEEVVGNAAILTTPGDIMEIRNAILKLTSDRYLCHKMGKIARKRLDENFTWEAVAERYVHIYERIVEKRKKPRTHLYGSKSR